MSARENTEVFPVVGDQNENYKEHGHSLGKAHISSPLLVEDTVQRDVHLACPWTWQI
jgi:hypothetical protein